ncbi:hypothetical protein HIM_05284 [Hirsutella minnesotensis 3608]|uniref:Aromatic prenyltransferase n=1 Tax=Hirsutella minnesotensis 3608 TaxID=1043627 RepID=A0A0F7ZUS2_9HYPO|nr:hypothetical protein HIM_05284 [Hirsutella minnesotensis 3608]
MTKFAPLPVTQGESSKVWQALSALLPPRSPDCNYWWKLTGKQLAVLVDAAGYTVEKQYEALLFHYHLIVPYLGPAPGPDGKYSWPSIFSIEGQPIEYSWKWNTATGKPVVRYTIEAKGHHTGTPMDPLNQEATRELLHRLQRLMPGVVDLTWTNHLLATLYDHDRSKLEQENNGGKCLTTTVMVATELEPSGLSFKTYFVPRRLGQSVIQIPLAVWKEAVAGICPENAAAAAVYDFLDGPEGALLSPFFLAVDNVKPEDSRLKFYFLSPHAKFSSIREIMTLGGRISISDERLQDLQSLVAAVTSLKAQPFAEDAEPPLTDQDGPICDGASAGESTFVPGCGYYFNIASGGQYPQIKLFVKLNTYGPGDLDMTGHITTWMATHGRGQYCQQFSSMLKYLCRDGQLGDKKGVYSYLSCMFKNDGKLEVTTYLKAETMFTCGRNGVAGEA